MSKLFDYTGISPIFPGYSFVLELLFEFLFVCFYLIRSDGFVTVLASRLFVIVNFE